jgi:hypothetical protein
MLIMRFMFNVFDKMFSYIYTYGPPHLLVSHGKPVGLCGVDRWGTMQKY